MRKAMLVALALGLAACGGDDTTKTETKGDSAGSISAPEPTKGDAPADTKGDAPADTKGDAPAEGAPEGGPEGGEGDAPEPVKPGEEGPAEPSNAVEFSLDGSKATHQVRASGSILNWVAVKDTSVEVKGALTNLGGEAILDFADLNKTQAVINIDLTAVESGDPARDNNLKTVFFDSMRPDSAGGRIDVLSLTSEPKTLAAGERGAGTAKLQMTVGRSVVAKTVPVEIERVDDNTLQVAITKAFPLSIADLGFEDNKAKLMTVCNHKALEDLVQASGQIVLEKKTKQ